MTDSGSGNSGPEKTDSANISFKQRKDILGNFIREDAKHPVHDTWRDIAEKEEMWKSDLGLDPLIARVLEEFQYSDWTHVRIKDRSELHAKRYSDTQITAARRKAMKIWPYIRQLHDFKERAEYKIYDLLTMHTRDIEESRRMLGLLARKYCDLLSRDAPDSDDNDPQDTDLGHMPVIERTPAEVQAKQLVREIKQRLEEEDRTNENYGKLDTLLYWVLREFYYARWDNPKIEDRESFRKIYTDSQITSARRKAARMWPYVRFVLGLRDEPEGGPIEGIVTYLLSGYEAEVRRLSEHVATLLKRTSELRRYNKIINEANSEEKRVSTDIS
jgi:hypothetical protein